jgi:hypothetical protein
LLLFAISACVSGHGASLGPGATSTPSSSTPAEPTTDAGLLPQTDALPAADSPELRSTGAALWAGVVQGSEGPALAAFFPESAYLQVKTLADAAGDYRNRLLAELGLDIAAAHALLGAEAASATLLSVRVPEQHAHWVPPGTCANRVGYYEVANSRLVYEEGGEVRSFGIASLISWRGRWYVVHLGAVVRSGPGGEVDAPEVGPGSSAPSSSC